MDPNPDYQVDNAKVIVKAIGYAFPLIIYIIVRIWNFISKSKKQADETAFANDTRAVKSNATQTTMPVVPSAAATIPSQTTAVTANTDTTYNGYYTTATQIPAVTANTDTTYNGYYTTATQIPAVTANTTQRDQLDNNFKNEMMEAEKRTEEAEKRAEEAEKRATEAEKQATEAKKQATEAKKQAAETAFANATQTTVPVAPSAAPAVPPRSLDERINALLKMKASGLITDAEFDQKRKELLDSI
jgi:hypothetical protein